MPRALWLLLSTLLRAAILAAGLAGAAIAQDTSPPGTSAPQLSIGDPGEGELRSPVLTVDTDRLFGDSMFGQRVLSELGAETEALAAENRRIEAELKEEERRLTERRPDMDVDAFRAEAEAFDARVQRIRQEQDAKELALQRRLSEGQEAFLSTVTPILGRLMLDRGAVVILDRRTVFLGVGLVDVTADAIEAIDAEIAAGEALDPAAPQ